MQMDACLHFSVGHEGSERCLSVASCSYPGTLSLRSVILQDCFTSCKRNHRPRRVCEVPLRGRPVLEPDCVLKTGLSALRFIFFLVSWLLASLSLLPMKRFCLKTELFTHVGIRTFGSLFVSLLLYLTWWKMPVLLALGRLRQEDHEFWTSLSSIYLKKKKIKYSHT